MSNGKTHIARVVAGIPDCSEESLEFVRGLLPANYRATVEDDVMVIRGRDDLENLRTFRGFVVPVLKRALIFVEEIIEDEFVLPMTNAIDRIEASDSDSVTALRIAFGYLIATAESLWRRGHTQPAVVLRSAIVESIRAAQLTGDAMDGPSSPEDWPSGSPD